MSALERVEMMLEAIQAVRLRANREQASGDPQSYKTAMEDLLALECSLVYEAQQLVDSIKNAA